MKEEKLHKKCYGYVCPECESLYKEEYQADNCCPKEDVKRIEVWECLACGQIHHTEKWAEYCCKIPLKRYGNDRN